MNATAAIHVARKQLGLDDDAARDLYQRVTGKRSLRDMSPAEQETVVQELRRHGFKPAAKALQGPFAGKLQALWIAGWNLGIVRDRSDHALLAFVKRQTNIDHTRFLVYAEDARKAVEALKDWIAREGGVNWSTTIATPQWLKQPGAQIALAQWQILVAAEAEPAHIRNFRAFVAFVAKPVDQMTANDWRPVMNSLGERVRKVAR